MSPFAPPKICTQPGCGKLVYEAGQSRCPAHQRVWKSKPRPSSSARGYDSEWRKIRDEKLEADPYCADPYHVHVSPVKATLVDHVKSLRSGGTHAWNNLQSLCNRCHKRKTVEFDGGGWQRQRGMGGKT